MNKTELVEVVASKAEITKVEAQKVVTATLDAIVGGIVKDGKVILPGFGTFETRTRAAHTGRDPRTGEMIEIRQTSSVAFRPGKVLKTAITKPRSHFRRMASRAPPHSAANAASQSSHENGRI